MALGDRTGSVGGGAHAVGGFEGPVGAGGGLRASAARHALLPLRLFLGGTFLYAGIHKLTDPAFLSGDGPGSLAQVLDGAGQSAALPALVELAQTGPTGFGIALAAGEIAVGLGTLAGLLGRLAALGGLLISLCLWLTVSWSSSPYYYGNDLPYLMAWVPLLLAGTPSHSLDAAFALRRRRRGRQIFG
ncbi:DoxX family membrane protein [Streptomyces sp. HNM0574]|uniref:DoxX family membrane protein n=1 Tax=Streptomyces sp. HNM0574 TaxID=2714954 RepID=UPI00146D345B|nr:DoxX family membrane protein [Streptomyces sp. HNM0574]NLU66856.1 DoxX family membrane protein [Streptomyces sp. HNM0574]